MTNAAKIVAKLLEDVGSVETYEEVKQLVSQWLSDTPGTEQQVKEFLVHNTMAKPGDDLYVEPGSREHGLIHVFINPADGSQGFIATLSPNGEVDMDRQ